MIVIDSYPEENAVLSPSTINTGTRAVGQSFTALNNATLTSSVFRVQRYQDSGTLTGSLVAKLYAHSGTYGTSSVPTGSPLATSEVIDIETLTPNVYGLVTFNFLDEYLLKKDTEYIIAIEATITSASNPNREIWISRDDTSPTHDGNQSLFDGTSWSAQSGIDTIFYVRGIPIIIDVTSDALSVINRTSLNAVGTFTKDSDNALERGFVYSTTSQSNPGDVPETSSGYEFIYKETGDFDTGEFQAVLGDLQSGTDYYMRAFVRLTIGVNGYGDELITRTAGFPNETIVTNLPTNPTNITNIV